VADTPKKIEQRIQLKQQEIQQTERLLDLERQRLRDATNLNLTIEEQRESYKKQLDFEGKAVSQHGQILSLLQKRVRLLNETLEIKRASGSLTAAMEANLQGQVAATETLIAEQYEHNRGLERELELRRRAVSQVDKLRSKTRDLISTLTGIDAAWKDTFIGSIATATNQMGSFRAATGAAFNSVLEATSYGNILGSTMLKIQEATMGMVMSLDEATVAFRKATGAGTEYNSRILAVFESNRRFGISLQDSAQSFQALFTNMSAFSSYGAGFQGDLSAVAAMLGKVGIDAGTFSANMDAMTRSFGMSASQAQQFSMDFAELGSTIGLPPEELAKQLNALTPRMAMFARTATTELRRLAAQSKSTGIEMQRLVGIAQGFDTFEDAASKVGQLNALMGGPFLNTMQMMMATDSERISIMKRAISSTGMMGEVMSGTGAKARFLRKALADVGGFAGNVDDMMRILRGDLNEFSDDALHAAGSLGSLQQRAMDNTTVMEKLANLMSFFAIQINNLLNLIRPLIDNVTKFADVTGNWFIPAVVGAGVAVRGVLGIFGSFVSSVFSGASGLTSLGASAGTAASGIGVIGTASSIAAIPLLAFGAAVAMIGGGIWAAGQGIAAMGTAFKTMKDIDVSGLVVSVGQMSSKVRELGTASAGATGNISNLLKTFSGRSTNINEASRSMLVMSQGLSSLTSALQNFSAEKANTLNNTLSNLSATFASSNIEDATRNLYQMASAATEVAKAVERIDPSKVNVMDQVAGGIKATVESAVQLSAAPEAVNATTRIAAAAARYAAAVNDARNLRDPLKDLIDTIRTSVTGGEATGGGGGGRAARGPSTVVLQMNNREFARTVVDIMESRVFNLRQG